MIDFFTVAERHEDVHKRLDEWARWVRPRGHIGFTQPIFRMYQSKARHWDIDPHIPVAINTLAAMEIERIVAGLPDKHRDVLRWAYVWPWVPVGKVRRMLALSMHDIQAMLHDGRDMTLNRLRSPTAVVRPQSPRTPAQYAGR